MNKLTTRFGTAGLIAVSLPAAAQPNAAPADSQAPAPEPADEFGGEEAIVVTGARARGGAIGDIPPENTLDARDVRATGATSVGEILESIAPQIGSAQGRGGGRPIILLNGQRISSFRELRDIPSEAIERVDILPEEVALKYGYRADQKVVNFVLRPRFHSTTARAGRGGATDGDYGNAVVDLTRLTIQRNGRTTFNLHAEGNGMLTEADRNILIAEPPSGATSSDALAARSLIPSKRDVRGTATFNRQILGDVAATLNAEIEHQQGRALVGLGDTLLLPLARSTRSDSAHAGLVLNGNKGDWRWTLTGNGDLARDFTSTVRSDPDAGRDRGIEKTRSADIKATANGKLFAMPAGDASTTLTLGGSTVNLESQRRQLGVTSSSSLDRTTGEAAVNADFPISRRNRDFSALGNLTLNANAEVDQLSDFGTLTTIGAGANWSPDDRLTFIASWSREEGPPTVSQLGAPVLDTPGTRIFDFTTGETVLVNAVTGGNPKLQSDRRKVFKLGANWQPLKETDLRLRGEYVHQTIARPISSLTVTPAVEAAFPERFQRDAAGQLVSVDLRPVNFESSQRNALRVGFDFTKPLKSHRPSQAVIDRMRAQFGGGSPRQPSSGDQPSPPREGGFRGGGFGGRGGGFFGGGNRGRLTFSVTDTITFADKVKIGPGLPEIDYLHGDAAGQSGGTPRHKLEAQAGYFNNGVGARVSANWRTGTRVNTLTGDDLRFSPLGTFDLRLFANPGDMPEIAVEHPWLRGTQIRFEANNLFNSRPKVRDSTGNVPLNYQPGLLDPLGRTVMISLRKLFLPSPSWFRQQRQRDEQQQSR